MKSRVISRIILCGMLLAAALPLPASHAGDAGEFKGGWIANGTRVAFPFVAGREVYTFKVGGHVNLQTALGKKKDYWSECVGLSDSVTGSVGRCVWKDLEGGELYLTLQSDRLQQDSLVTGTIVGGSGPLAGISGELTFKWSSVTFQADAAGGETMTGQTLNLAGRYQLP